jgi:mono/diheme cytochrome c family protein
MKRALVWVVAAAALGLAACGDDNDDNGGAAAPAPTSTGCTPPATPTATFAQVHPILTSSCGSCHGTSFGSSDRATAYAAASSRVSTTTPDDSLLLQKGDARTTHAGGDQLDPAEVTSVTAWIRECAQNN